MITTIYLVRHVDSVYTLDELNRSISKQGKIDSIELKNQFKDIVIDKVFSSPYRRSIETVELLADSRNLQLEIVDDFKERIKGIGKLDNFYQNVAELWENENFNYVGGESNKSGQDRGVKALNFILDFNQGKNLVIGTHGDLMTLILNYYDKSYSFDFWKKRDMPDAYKLEFEGQHIKSINRIWHRNRI